MAECDHNDHLICVICRGFFHKPVTTPCGHTYCRKCLEKHIKYSPGQPRCPLCKKHLSSELPGVNVVIQDLVQLYKRKTNPVRFTDNSPRDWSKNDIVAVRDDNDGRYYMAIVREEPTWDGRVTVEWDVNDYVTRPGRITCVNKERIKSLAEAQSEGVAFADLYCPPQEEAPVIEHDPGYEEHILTDTNTRELGIHAACILGVLELLAEIYDRDKDASLNKVDRSGFTPAQYALHYGHIGCLELLRSYGARIELHPDLQAKENALEWFWANQRNGRIAQPVWIQLEDAGTECSSEPDSGSLWFVTQKVFANYQGDWYAAEVKEVCDGFARIIYEDYEADGEYRVDFSDLKDHFKAGDTIRTPLELAIVKEINGNVVKFILKDYEEQGVQALHLDFVWRSSN